MAGLSPVERDVIALLGRLGNQLFQVAFAHWLEQRTGREGWYDVSFSRDPLVAPHSGRSARFARSPLALDVLKVPGFDERLRGRVLTQTRWWPTPDGRASILGRVMRRAWGPRRIVRDYTSAGPNIPAPGPAAWWFGYWQRAEYADTLIPELCAALGELPIPPHEQVIGVHVRRGDMVGNPAITAAAWFRHGLERVRDELGDGSAALPIRVWTDDPSRCRRELDLGVPFDVADGSAIEQLRGLSACRALVVSRPSTFAWWAARIATERAAPVVYPSPWWPGAQHLKHLIVHPSWIGLDDRLGQAR